MRTLILIIVFSQQLLLLKSEPDNGYTVGSANRIYVNETFPLGVTFQREISNTFHADAHNVDFKGTSIMVSRKFTSVD